MVIISSFYNEEYLLPWWLTHHKKIFDHGILFNYFSTDKSVEIIKHICPNWEIHDTKNKDWDPRTNDMEFMETERAHEGYKMTLTTTEFLTGNLPALPQKPTIYTIPIIRMVDTEIEKKPTHNKPLTIQKKVGYLDKSFRKRFLHNYLDGAYATGRDRTARPNPIKSGLKILKYTFSPWTPKMKKRRLQMKDFMSSEHLRQGWGKQHKHTPESLEKEYQKALERDLRIWI